MNDAERRRNATDSFGLAIATLRDDYLANRQPGESAAQYAARRRPPPPVAYPVVTQDHLGGPIRVSIHTPTESGGTSTASAVLTPRHAVEMGAQLCALGANELSSKGR